VVVLAFPAPGTDGAGEAVSEVEAHIDVAVPVARAYDAWTRFEDLPRFMDGVDEVRQIDETHLLWRASYDGTSTEWTCEVVELRPQERIAWRSTSGVTHGGVLSFLRLDDAMTRVMVMAEIDSGDADAVAERIDAALTGFKALMERR
jgi:uncharacterized membrane protein